MVARKVVPFLLIAGGVMMFMHHKRHELIGQCGEGERRTAISPRGDWGRRVPPMFERWHKRAHEQEVQPATPAPAV
jgi:hypothetical protein